MLKNYLKIAWRNFLHDTSYSLINILGLSIGLCCLILILLFVTDELSYDRFHPDHGQIHSVARTVEYGGEEHTYLSNFFPLGATMVSEIPEVESFVNTTYPGAGAVSADGSHFMQSDNIIASTSGFFTQFNFSLSEGDPARVLSRPGTVVITEELAQKLFPDTRALGKIITIDRYGKHEYEITGIAQNPPKNSYLTFDAVFSIEGLPSTNSNRNSWGSSMYNTFVKLTEGTSWKDIEPELEDLVNTHMGKESTAVFFSIPIADLYLSDLVNVEGFKGDYMYIYLFSAIGLFIILLASINYMNLATARAIQRGKEVGIRKVMGADRKQLIRQFLGESVITTIISLVVALFLVELTAPYFNAFFDKEISFSAGSYGLLLGALLLLSVVLGITSGSYPAFFLSRLQPSGILKNRSANPGGKKIRKGLIVFQFCISSILIISTLVVLNQLDYLLNKDLGFQKEEVLYIPFDSDQSEQMNAFKQTIESHQAALAVSSASGIPGRFWFSKTLILDSGKEISAHIIEADKDYADALGFKLLAGRFVDHTRASDVENGVVINESMVKEMGFSSPAETIGKELPQGKLITGVINDFHFQSLKQKVSPVIIETISDEPGTFSGGDLIAVRFRSESLGELLGYMNLEWNSRISAEPMPVSFLDDELRKYYETEDKLGKAFSFFAGISILIACLGLFGLAAFSSQLRVKEIGIRKVLGATVSNILGLLTRDFVKLVLIGFLVSIPVAFYLMNQWLSGFAYRIHIGVNTFLIAGVIAILIAVLAVSWQSIRAALANPVDSLRSE